MKTTYGELVPGDMLQRVPDTLVFIIGVIPMGHDIVTVYYIYNYRFEIMKWTTLKQTMFSSGVKVLTL